MQETKQQKLMRSIARESYENEAPIRSLSPSKRGPAIMRRFAKAALREATKTWLNETLYAEADTMNCLVAIRRRLSNAQNHWLRYTCLCIATKHSVTRAKQRLVERRQRVALHYWRRYNEVDERIGASKSMHVTLKRQIGTVSERPAVIQVTSYLLIVLNSTMLCF